MAKLQRKSAKVFAENATAGIGGIAQFGSLAAGNEQFSKDVDVIQALNAYKNGWSSAVTGNKSPAIEDRNALDYLLSYQQAYIMQHGIPEWLSTETYYEGSFASVGYALYVSKTDNNIGNNPTTDSTETNWIKFPTPQQLADGLALKVNKAGDTMTGDLIMSGATVKNLVGGTQYRVLDTRDVNSGIAVGYPDLTAGVSISSGYVTTQNGWVRIHRDYYQTGGSSLYFDSVEVWKSITESRDGRDSINYYAQMVPVKSGVTVTWTGGASCEFYPNKSA